MKKLYDYMDWEAIEAVTYADEPHPKRVLGARVVKQGILIQCFFPGEKEITLKASGKNYPMELVDEAGFFAALIPGKRIPKYTYLVGSDKSKQEVYDPYSFDGLISDKDEVKFHSGIWYEMYDVLGSHIRTISGVTGTYFAVWAPNALRVSVIGDFNDWDGRTHLMERRDGSGIYELFIPQNLRNSLYKYEIKIKGDHLVEKRDPFSFKEERRIDGASIVTDLDYSWSDAGYLLNRETKNTAVPMAVLKVDPAQYEAEGNMLKAVTGEVERYGYTHVELMNVGEKSHFYSPLFLAEIEKFSEFVNMMHGRGIGVIMDLSPSHFTREESGLSKFDGTPLYEETEITRRQDVLFGDNAFNFGSQMVRNYLISSALFFADRYHIDGIKLDMLDAMLYLDYGRAEGEWKSNIYGGNENLDVLEYVKHLNSILHKRHKGVITIAEDNSNWPLVTAPLSEDGLGFDYKWNRSFADDLLDYMCLDPLYRGGHHEELLLSMIYAYSEHFIIGYPYKSMLSGHSALYYEMPGEDAQKMANLRLLMAYIIAHPGKKLYYHDALIEEKDSFFDVYMQNLLELYRKNPALYYDDFTEGGFEWIDNLEWEKNLLVFIRKTERSEETLLFVCNFSGKAFDKLPVGVPYAGKYKEIFNTDTVTFGGEGYVNPRIKMSKPVSISERDNSIVIKMAPLSIAVFTYTKAVEKVSGNQNAKKKIDKKQSIHGKVRKTGTKNAKEDSLKEVLEKKITETS